MNRLLLRGGAAAMLLIFFCGCESLPAGMPPSGKIVDNPGIEGKDAAPAALTWEDAEEQLISELTPVTLLHCPGQAVALDADAASFSAAREVLDRCGELSGVRCVIRGKTEYQLRSRLLPEPVRWRLSLVSGNEKTLWETVIHLQKNPQPRKDDLHEK